MKLPEEGSSLCEEQLERFGLTVKFESDCCSRVGQQVQFITNRTRIKVGNDTFFCLFCHHQQHKAYNSVGKSLYRMGS